MRINNGNLELQFEKAVRLLGKYMPKGETRKKPIIIHSLRVGFYLYQKGYSENIIMAGLLHDVLEWTKYPKKTFEKEFGKKVYLLTLANTQNSKIKDKVKKWQGMVDRCSQAGEDALIVKAADVIDSLQFYRKTKNQSEIQRSIDIGKYVLQKAEGKRDEIFAELEKALRE